MVMAEIPAQPDYIPRVDYKTLNIPLVLVWGDRDTWVSDIARAREVHGEVSGSRLLIVKGPHTILYRKPWYVINEIVKELRQMKML